MRSPDVLRRLGIASTCAALVATVAFVLGPAPASAQQTQRVDLDLILLTRASGQPQNGETWQGTAATLATGEQWTLTMSFGPWGNVGAACGRLGTWQLRSVTNPGDSLGGPVRQGESTIAVGVNAALGTGRFAGYHSGTNFNAAILLPQLLQVGGCTLTGFVAGLVSGGLLGAVPVSGLGLPLGFLNVLPVGALTVQSPIALGSLRIDLQAA